MTTINDERPDLMKWPRLIVKGDNVTPEQANEIIIRTTCLWLLYSNDMEWEQTVHKAFNIPDESTYARRSMEWYDATDVIARALAHIPLEYMHNTDRISSCYFLGPHGWCNWDGKIHATEYRIGKWPSREEMTRECADIAAAFPYLKMTVQLIADPYESDVVEDNFASAQWDIHDGTAAEVWPCKKLVARPDDDYEERMIARFNDPDGERGVKLNRLNEAIAQVRKMVELGECSGTEDES